MDVRNWVDGMIQIDPDSELLLHAGKSWLTRSVTKHNLPSVDAYTEALVRCGTQLTDAVEKNAAPWKLADIMNSLAKSTGHSCEVTAAQAARMGQLVHARGEAGQLAFPEETVYNGVANTIKRAHSEYRESITGAHK